jgi:transcriptional regulator with XRE-family HTH domain
VQEAMIDARLKPTQTAAAELAGIKQPSVNLWKQPGGYPTMENAVKLAHKLNVNVEWLMTERGPKRPAPSDSYAQQLWTMWSELSEGDKRELVVRAEGWLQRRDSEAPEDRQRA